MSLLIQKLDKHFANGKHALRDINLSIGDSEMVALIGASGSGKSTLLRMVAGLLEADATPGSLIEVNGLCVQRNGRIASNVRSIRSQVGFVFQQFNLVDRLPVFINVLVGRLHAMPWWRGVMGLFNAHERSIALEALERVGILDCHAQRASTLSGGQQQRVFIARALVKKPELLILDEPTVGVDVKTQEKFYALMQKLNHEYHLTILLVSHDLHTISHQVHCVMQIDKKTIPYATNTCTITHAHPNNALNH